METDTGRERRASEDAANEAAFAAACAQAAAGRLQDACDALISLRARLAQPSANLELQLGVVHLCMGDREAAAQALRDALALDPTLFRAHALLARLRADAGDAAGAEASLREAERHAPADAGQWRELGQMHAEYWRWEDADRALTRADTLEPAHVPSASLAAIVKAERGDDAGARLVLERARARDPRDLAVALAYNLYLPQVYESVEDLQRWRARYTRGLGEIASDLGRWQSSARQVLELNRTNFLLAYQGYDDRALQQDYSRLLSKLALAARPDWREPPPRPREGRVRVGFVGNIFRECTAGRYFEHWITGLDAGRFERLVFYTGPVVDDVTRRIAAGCDAFSTLRTGGEATIDRLREARLDILVQPDVGMTPLSYLLAAVRVAPVQCAGWGHPVTTGGVATDHYFTCSAMEPDEGPTHYTERLIGLPGGLGVRYPQPPAPEPYAREELRLPVDKRLYACPQSLFKIHPAMDAVLARILETDPQGVLVFFQSPGRAVSERFAARLQRALSARGIEPAGQVKFLPRMNADAFRRVLAAADVVVDTLHWSGGNTSLDAIAAGTPIVTLPGAFMRGRQSAAMVQAMGVDGLVATSEDDLAARAVDIARDQARNRDLRAAIAAGRAALFDRSEPVEAFSQALLGLAAR